VFTVAPVSAGTRLMPVVASVRPNKPAMRQRAPLFSASSDQYGHAICFTAFQLRLPLPPRGFCSPAPSALAPSTVCPLSSAAARTRRPPACATRAVRWVRSPLKQACCRHRGRPAASVEGP
jgi:hypothetical protein